MDSVVAASLPQDFSGPQASDPPGFEHSPGAVSPGGKGRGHLGLIVAGSMLAGLVAALLLVLLVVGPQGFKAPESAVTGAALVGFAAGWSLLAGLSWRTEQPQRWALAPAAATALTGAALDIDTVPALREQWLRAIDQEQPRLFVVDLSAVTFLDSTSLAALVAVRQRQREHGGEVIVVNANPRLAKIFHITGLDFFIQINGQDGDCPIGGASSTAATVVPSVEAWPRSSGAPE